MELSGDILKEFADGQTNQEKKQKALSIRSKQIDSWGRFDEYMKVFNSFKRIDLSGNYLQTIPEGFSEGSKVEELDLGENVFDTIKGFENNQYLKVLSLSCNSISKIQGFHNMPELQVLVLSIH
jgi:Leucine-rich repeat (LRR) protein